MNECVHAKLLSRVQLFVTPRTVARQTLLPMGNPMNRGVWWAAVHGVAKSQMGLKQLSTHPEYFHNVTDTYFT